MVALHTPQGAITRADIAVVQDLPMVEVAARQQVTDWCLTTRESIFAATTSPRIRWCLLCSPNLQFSMRRRILTKSAKMAIFKSICPQLRKTLHRLSRPPSAHLSSWWRMLEISWISTPVLLTIQRPTKMALTFNTTTISLNLLKSCVWISWLTRKRPIASLIVRCLQPRMIQALPKTQLESISPMEKWEIYKLSLSTLFLSFLDGTASITLLLLPAEAPKLDYTIFNHY